MQTNEIYIWTACPHDIPVPLWGELVSLLDSDEWAHVAKLQVEEDRRSYVLAHAVRRAALARALDVPPGEVAFCQEANGRPLLVAPPSSGFFFSHSRRRRAIAFALTRAGPVGIDIEVPVAGAAHPELLAPFMDWPGTHRTSDHSAQFYFHWTALEAFWKAEGAGLSCANPRIRCEKRSDGTFEIAMAANTDHQPRAAVFPIDNSTGCDVTLVLNYAGATAPSRWPKLFHFDGATEILQLFNDYCPIRSGADASMGSVTCCEARVI